ncbi:hypothetical protein ACS0TY_018266 [Phlomoides rotata]
MLQFPGGGTSYNTNARKHENFSYSNPKAAVQFPPGFDPGAKLPTHEGKATNEDALALILKKMEENGKIVTQQYKGLETQFTQLSQQQNHGLPIGATCHNGGKHAKQRKISFNHRAKSKRTLQVY